MSWLMCSMYQQTMKADALPRSTSTALFRPQRAAPSRGREQDSRTFQRSQGGRSALHKAAKAVTMCAADISLPRCAHAHIAASVCKDPEAVRQVSCSALTEVCTVQVDAVWLDPEPARPGKERSLALFWPLPMLEHSKAAPIAAAQDGKTRRSRPLRGCEAPFVSFFACGRLVFTCASCWREIPRCAAVQAKRDLLANTIL